MRKLFFTTGSPFARAVRIVLVEKGLDFERDETFTTPSVEERARIAPTLQVPTLIDGKLTLWDSAVIIEYLMSNYPEVAADGIQPRRPPPARRRWRGPGRGAPGSAGPCPRRR